MKIVYQQSESLVEPSEIDVTSSQGVYVRRNIKTFERDENTVYSYEEAFLTRDEYAQYQNELIAKKIKGEDNSQAYDNYMKKLDTAVEYPVTGFTYKPKWAETVYAGLIEKGSLLPSLFPLKIFDSTEEEARAVSMTLQELIALAIFLAQKQEEYFAEYKAEKTA